MTQKERVIKRLLERKQITRNECLMNYISRLSAIIYSLEEEGWEFKRENIDGDYYYFPTKIPIKIEQFKNPISGEIINKYKK